MRDEDIFLGAVLYLKPSIDSERDLPDHEPKRCVVVYIHPERRYYVVEFTFPAGSFRETFYFQSRSGNILSAYKGMDTGKSGWHKGEPKFDFNKRLKGVTLSQKERTRK